MALSDDALIVSAYMQNAASAILWWMRLRPATASEPAQRVEIDDRTPAVIHFDQIAALTTLAGALRLEAAALAVQRHASGNTVEGLDNGQRRLLRLLASGAAIVDIGAELGYSRRSIHRAMSRLFGALGVDNRSQAVHRAAAHGLLD